MAGHNIDPPGNNNNTFIGTNTSASLLDVPFNATDPQAGPSGAGQGRVYRFAFNTTDPNIVFAATAGGGLWKTSDKGKPLDPLSDGVHVMNTTGDAVDYVSPT